MHNFHPHHYCIKHSLTSYGPLTVCWCFLQSNEFCGWIIWLWNLQSVNLIRCSNNVNSPHTGQSVVPSFSSYAVCPRPKLVSCGTSSMNASSQVQEIEKGRTALSTEFKFKQLPACLGKCLIKGWTCPLLPTHIKQEEKINTLNGPNLHSCITSGHGV